MKPESRTSVHFHSHLLLLSSFFDFSHIYICGMAFPFSGPTLNQSALALLRGLSILRPMLLGFSSMAGIFQIPVQIDINVVL